MMNSVAPSMTHSMTHCCHHLSASNHGKIQYNVFTVVVAVTPHCSSMDTAAACRVLCLMAMTWQCWRTSLTRTLTRTKWGSLGTKIKQQQQQQVLQQSQRTTAQQQQQRQERKQQGPQQQTTCSSSSSSNSRKSSRSMRSLLQRLLGQMLCSSSQNQQKHKKQPHQQLTALLPRLLLRPSTFRSQYVGRSVQQMPSCIPLEAQAC
jgi:hypothetical protein